MKKAVQKNINTGIEIKEVKERVRTSDLMLKFFFESAKNGEIESHTRKNYDGRKLFKLFCIRNGVDGSSKSKLKKKLENLGIL